MCIQVKFRQSFLKIFQYVHKDLLPESVDVLFLISGYQHQQHIDEAHDHVHKVVTQESGDAANDVEKSSNLYCGEEVIDRRLIMVSYKESVS